MLLFILLARIPFALLARRSLGVVGSLSNGCQTKRNLIIMLLILLGSSHLSAYIISYNDLQKDNPIMLVAPTIELSWDNDQLFTHEIDPLVLRSYPFNTINSAGFYRLASNVSNKITISASNVTLDMNGCSVTTSGTPALVVNGSLSNVTVTNGTVSATGGDGIQIASGCIDIMLDGITVNGAQRGISLTNVTNGIIRNCELLASNTGLELNTCHNIVIQNCTASTNLYAGFSLITSTTCAFFDCNALSTGQGNTDQTTNIYGFVNSGGSGTIFERCIANSTQGLTVTGAQGVIAGFALLGTGVQCHKIVDCEAGNAVTNANNGVTIPYGIYLQNTISSSPTLTAAPTIPVPSTNVNQVDWTSDGQYLAVGSNSGDAAVLRVYQYNRLLQIVDQVATSTVLSGVNVLSVAWNPDPGFLAIGSSANPNSIRMYQFNRLNNTLFQLGNPLPNFPLGGTANSVAWSSDGLYLAAGGKNGSGSIVLAVYFFDHVKLTTSQAVQLVVAGGSINGISYSHSGDYIAVGQSLSPFLVVYKFSRTGNALTTFAQGSGLANIQCVSFSPDDNYVAIGMANGSSVNIYAFSKTAQTLTLVVSQAGTSSGINELNWSADGKFLAVANNSNVIIYQFDRGANTLTQVATINTGNQNPTSHFSPDGKYLANGNQSATPFLIYQVMSFPTGNLIMNNKTYCNVGNEFGGGIGISGSSIDNTIIGNSSYNNQFNYAYVCNVFNQRFGDAPTGLQNISNSVSNVLQTPIDLPTNLGRIQVLAQSLVDILI